MLQLKRKIMLISSTIILVLPIVTIVSCHHDVDDITKTTLNKEAKTLVVSNFLYDGQSFDTSKIVSIYKVATKISGTSLSNGTELIAIVVAAIRDSLKITYKLKNGNAFSNIQKFIYNGFASEVPVVKAITKETLNDEAKALTKDNFHYGDKAFDISKVASTYNDAKKVFILLLSKNTKFNVFKIVEENTTLAMSYTLKNGSITSDPQWFRYHGFKIKDFIIASDIVKKAMIYLEKEKIKSGPKNVDQRAGVNIFFLRHSNFKIKFYKDEINQITNADLTSINILDWYKTFTKATEKAKGIRVEIEFSSKDLRDKAKLEGKITRLVIRPSDTKEIIPSEQYINHPKKIAKWGKTLNDIRPDQSNSKKAILQVWAILENGEEVPFSIMHDFRNYDDRLVFKKSVTQEIIDSITPILTYNGGINDETQINVDGKEVSLLQYILADETIKNGKTLITEAIFTEISKKLSIKLLLKKNIGTGNENIPFSTNEKSLYGEPLPKFIKVSHLVLNPSNDDSASIRMIVSSGTNLVNEFKKTFYIEFRTLLSPTLYAERILTRIFKRFRNEAAPLAEFVDDKQGVHLWSVDSSAFLFEFKPKLSSKKQTVKSWYKLKTQNGLIVKLRKHEGLKITSDYKTSQRTFKVWDNDYSNLREISDLYYALTDKKFVKFVIRPYDSKNIRPYMDKKEPRVWGRKLVDVFPSEKDSTKATLQVWALFKKPNLEGHFWVPFVIKNIPSSKQPFKKTLNHDSVEKATDLATKIGKLKTGLTVSSKNVKALIALIKTTDFSELERKAFQVALTKILESPTEGTKYTVLDPKLVTYDVSTKKLVGKIYVTKGKKLNNLFVKEIVMDIIISL